jgi:hypothetical protein
MSTPIIPSPDIFRGFSVEAKDPTGPSLPTTAQCAAHLELLMVFYTLRRKVEQSLAFSDSLGCEEERELKSHSSWRRKSLADSRKSAITATQQLKWTVYLEFAVERLLHWLERVDALSEAMSTTTVNTLPPVGESVSSPNSYIPMLRSNVADCLMAWHSFLLNPKYFRSYCEEKKLQRIRQVPFPWQRIVSHLRRVILRCLRSSFPSENLVDFPF